MLEAEQDEQLDNKFPAETAFELYQELLAPCYPAPGSGKKPERIYKLEKTPHPEPEKKKDKPVVENLEKPAYQVRSKLLPPLFRSKQKLNLQEEKLSSREYRPWRDSYQYRTPELIKKIREIENAIKFLGKRLSTYPKNIQAIIDELVDLSPKDSSYILSLIKTYRVEILNKK